MSQVPDPFRSDERFWRSVAASADALIALVLAVITAVALKLFVGGGWSVAPFVLPVAFFLRAGITGRASARASRAAFASGAEWRAAERDAVARVFWSMLVRNRLRPYGQVHKQNG